MKPVLLLICLYPEMIKPGKDQRDYYYFMAVGHYKLEVGVRTITSNYHLFTLIYMSLTIHHLHYKHHPTTYASSQEYEASQSCVNRVLQMEPNNYQAKQLKELVQKKIKRGTCTDTIIDCVYMQYTDRVHPV